MSIMFRKLVLVCCLFFSSISWGLDGFLEPVEEVDISASETGVIVRKKIVEGDQVKKNDTLVELDSSVLRASLTGARADYQAKKRRQQEIDILYQQSIASVDELNTAKTQTTMALSQFQVLQRQISRRLIKSPINGIVTLINGDVGELVSQSNGPFIKVVNTSQLKLTVYIAYEKTANLTIGQSLLVKVSGFVDQQKAVIRYISPVVDPASSTVKVELIIENTDNKLRSGVPAAVQFNG